MNAFIHCCHLQRSYGTRTTILGQVKWKSNHEIEVCSQIPCTWLGWTMGVYVCCVCAHICMCSRMTQYKGVQSIEEATTCRNKSRAKRNGLGPKSPFSTPTPSVSLWVMTVSPIIIGRSQRHGGKTLPGGKGAGVCPSQPPLTYVTLIFPLAVLEV